MKNLKYSLCWSLSLRISCNLAWCSSSGQRGKPRRSSKTWSQVTLSCNLVKDQQHPLRLECKGTAQHLICPRIWRQVAAQNGIAFKDLLNLNSSLSIFKLSNKAPCTWMAAERTPGSGCRVSPTPASPEDPYNHTAVANTISGPCSSLEMLGTC